MNHSLIYQQIKGAAAVANRSKTPALVQFGRIAATLDDDPASGALATRRRFRTT
jgi:hypothetical protein